jgi:predicted amidohydrolase
MLRTGLLAPFCPREFLLANRDGRASSFTVSVIAEIDHETGIEAAINSAPTRAALVILPYLGASKWFLDEPDRKGYAQAERVPSRTLSSAISAATTRRIPVIVSFYEVVAEGTFYATSAVIDSDGSVLGSYRQAHAINKPGWHEQLYFQPGTSGFPVFEVRGAKIGLLMGSDLWVPEAARLLALNGAEIIVSQVLLRDEDARLAELLAAARAIENGCAVILANRGMAAVAFAQTGGLVKSVSENDGQTSIAIELTELRARRRAHYSLPSRRPAIYGGLARGDEEALP